MYIMHLTDFYHPIIGGLERNVETLAQEQIRLGHRVVVVTLQTGALPDEEVISGVRVIRIRSWSQKLISLYEDASRPFHPTVPDPGAISELRSVIRREQPDIVHSNGWLAYSCLALHSARRGPAHVMTLHDYGLACAKKTLLHSPGGEHCVGPQLAKCLACVPTQYGVAKGAVIATGLRASRILHGRVDRYIAISTAVAEGSSRGMPAGRRVAVIPDMVPNGLPRLAQATPRPQFLPPTDGYLMFAGALGPHKGLDILLEARSRMRNRPPLVLIGMPRADTPPINDPDIIVAHNMPSAQVMAAWMRSSVAVVPSVWQEPQGLVAIEAMLMGRPVVASDVGGLRDIVEHGLTGLMVPPGKPDALAAALDKLLDDSALRERLGQTGKERARRFEAASVAPRIMAVYEGALRDRATESTSS
jgi:glycosyltransferase involved in cell wall biosynthesis